MNVYAGLLVVCIGYVAAQPDPFGDTPDYGDQLVGSPVGGSSGETNNFDVFAEAAAAAGGGGAGMAGAGGAGGGFMGQGNGAGFGYNGGNQQGYGGAGPDLGVVRGQPFGGAVGGIEPGMGGNPFLDVGDFDNGNRMPFNNNPHLVKDAHGRAQTVSASTVAGATIAVIVVVVIFAGIAFFVVKQRRNSRIMIASV